MIKNYSIKAERFDGSTAMVKKYQLIRPIPREPHYRLTTPEGITSFDIGDWIATGVEGEHWLIADAVFKQTYAELPVIPREIACLIVQAKRGDYDLGLVLSATYSGIWKASIGDWIVTHTETFARAWLDGYTVEEDK